jgi:hypothetical protein
MALRRLTSRFSLFWFRNSFSLLPRILYTLCAGPAALNLANQGIFIKYGGKRECPPPETRYNGRSGRNAEIARSFKFYEK